VLGDRGGTQGAAVFVLVPGRPGLELDRHARVRAAEFPGHPAAAEVSAGRRGVHVGRVCRPKQRGRQGFSQGERRRRAPLERRRRHHRRPRGRPPPRGIPLQNAQEGRQRGTPQHWRFLPWGDLLTPSDFFNYW
jgi:hypothetical protein